MSASDAGRRALTTAEFLEHGLGAKLTRNAQVLIRGLAEEEFGDAYRWAIGFATGSIVERVVWQAYGTWMGYFDPIPPITDAEQRFLAEHVRELDMPEAVQELALRLAYPDSAIGQEFYNQAFPFWGFSRPIQEWFPIFQAMLITAELLNEPVMAPFLLFLQRGEVEAFKQQSSDADEVLLHLEKTDYTAPFRSNEQRPEPVLAGFIRFTEYLSAAEGIYPEMETAPSGEIASSIPSRLIDRDILFSSLQPYRWRAPQGLEERFQAVLLAFLELTAAELGKYPAMAVQWSYVETFREIMSLSYKFFFQPGAPNVEGSEEMSQRQRAIERRLRALREDEPESLA